MARRKRCSPSLFTVGNCKVEVEGGGISCETPNAESLAITCSKKTKIMISVNDSGMHNSKTSAREPTRSLEYHDTGKQIVPLEDFHFHLVNPNCVHDQSKSLIQEISKIYTNELPSMYYSANTERECLFLKTKYRTLALSLNSMKELGEVIAAISFQILPVNTQFAEIPLAAVTAKFQHKGFGRLLFEELKKRLQDIGVMTIFCWADKESEGFWLKQGFSSIGTVNSQGRMENLPIKADIRKVLSFPGDPTLMVVDTTGQSIVSAGLGRTTMHLNLFLPAKALVTSRTSMNEELRDFSSASQCDYGKEPIVDTVSLCTAKAVPELPITSEEDNHLSGSEQSAGFGQSRKGRWETCISSLKSKRIKAGRSLDFNREFDCNKIMVQGITQENVKSIDELNRKECPKIMLMNIADQAKKEFLAKIIEKLGGSVTSEGTFCTHIITGKARRTMNFCIALCSGAWVLSSNWLKESYRMGRFQDESKFLLEDPDYSLRYKAELSEAVIKARQSPCSLLKGYQICITKHVQPCRSILSTIIESASGAVIRDLDDMLEPSKTIFLTCEEDIDEALEASKQGILTYGSEWFMSCVMKQELDFDAPQFAESL